MNWWLNDSMCRVIFNVDPLFPPSPFSQGLTEGGPTIVKSLFSFFLFS